jgi:biopolymer transport protein ExbB
MKSTLTQHMKKISIILATALTLLPGVSHAWWNGDWDTRKKITLNTTQVATKDNLLQTPVLVRLHTGDFDFGNVKENGGDIRFVAEDDKTVLKYHIEKFDSINEMALIWVQVPQLTAGKSDTIWMYSGNSKATPADDAKGTFDANQTAVLHFDEADGLPQDRTSNASHAAQFTGKLTDGSLIGRGATFDGTNSMVFAALPALKLVAAQGLTVSAWIKTAAGQNNAVLFAQQEGANAVKLAIAGGKLYGSFGATETPKTADVAPGVWHHVAMTAGKTLTVYLDGKEVAQVPVTLADMQGQIVVGNGFAGEMDEFELSNTARSADAIKVAAAGQGADALLVGYGQDEANGGGGEGSYFGTILHSVTLDGWVVIGLLFVMAVISWIVMALKAVVITKVQRGNKAFLRDYNNLSLSDTAKLDHAESEEDAEIDGSQLLIALYGKHDHYQDSTLYRIYHTGMQEIKNRFGKTDPSQQYLTPQAIGSIKASLDATLVRENQKLSSLMVLLTIAISGGPFLGLLGTVVGVMITFAAIAATGDVNVAAIAPGIAAALVATVAGLAVAIPALFGYNYLGSVIKNSNADMHIFVDEFTSRITEVYSR